MSRKKIVLFLFFASGLSSLVYEVVWMRHLALVFGCTVYATATVLAGFMGGLAVGSYLLGRIADKTQNQIRLYGILEFLIGCFAIVFPFILKGFTPLYIWLARVFSTSYHSLSLLQALLIICVLIIPAAMMGGTLPLMTRYLNKTFSSLGSNLSLLYGINTLGAVIGCSAAGFFLIGTFGMRATTGIAVVINFLVAGMALFLAGTECKEDSKEQKAVEEEQYISIRYPSWYPRLLLILFAFSGFTALAYEVLWTRVLVFLVGSTSYAFTAMLSTYLCGIALGSMLISRRIDRIKQLAETFGVLEMIVGLVTLVTLGAFPLMLSAIGNFLFEDGAFRYSHITSFVVLQGGMALFFVFPITLLLGFIFPIMGKLYSEVRGQIGSGVGTIYFADTIGAIAGSVAAGFLLIPRLGTLLSLEVMALINLLIGTLAFSAMRNKREQMRFVTPRCLALAILVTAIFFGCRMNIPKDTFAGIFTAPNAKLTYISEDIGGTVTVEQYETYKTISINGVNVAGTDLKFKTTQKLQAHLALLLHPEPQDVLQIGFGSGGTAWAITRHPVRQIDCVEITEAVIKAGYLMKEVNHGVLEDPRVRVIIDDARSYMLKCEKKYDVILSDSIHPRLSGNGGLYSVDYFKICREKLAANGIFSAWLPFHGLSTENYRVAARSLKEVFPHVYIFHTPVGRNEWTIIIGTSAPLRIDVEKLRRKMESAALKEDLGKIYINRIESLLACFLIGDEKLGQFLGSSRTLNTDDFPYLEYVAPKSGVMASREDLLLPLYYELVKHRENLEPYLSVSESTISSGIDLAYRSSEHLLRGRLLELQEKERCPGAVAEFKKALELDPDNMIAKDLLGK